MYKYINIKQIIAIKEYQNYEYSIRKMASEINCSKFTVHRVSKQLSIGLSPINIFSQLETNQRKAGQNLIEVNETDVEIVNNLVKIKQYSPDIISHILRQDNPSNISTKTNCITCLRQIGMVEIKVCYCEKGKINRIRKLKI